MSAPAKIRVRRVSDLDFEKLRDVSTYRALEKFRMGEMMWSSWCWIVQPHDTQKIILLVFQNWELVDATEIYDGSITDT